MKAYEKVLLIIPRAGMGDYADRPHTGIGYLSEILTRNSIDNYVLDMRLGYTIEDLFRVIGELKPDLIGMTMMSKRHDIAYNFISKIKCREHQIVVGGPHISALRSKVLEECGADFAIKLEGEYPLAELSHGMEYADIKNLIYRNGTQVIENEDRPFIRDLDSIPFPRYQKFELRKYGKVIPIVSSRGCPYPCIYCSIKVSMGRLFRARSAENVIEEMEYWYNRGYRTFDFVDDNFTLIKDRVYEICDLIEERRLRRLELYCTNGVRADRVDKDVLRRMKEVGFTYVCFGVESGSNKVLSSIKKGVNIETIEEAIRNACELGYEVGLFFIIGSPGETPSDVEDSLKIALKYPVAMADFYNLIPFPGTELFEWVKGHDYFIENPYEKLNYVSQTDYVPYFETPEFPLEERIKALAKAARIVKEIRGRHVKYKLTRNFGPFGKILAGILYFDPLYYFIRQNYYESGSIRKIVDPIKHRLKIYNA